MEAQANGLKCLFSDRVTKETKLSPSAEFLSLDELFMWVRRIQKYRYGHFDCKQRMSSKLMIRFDISKQSISLRDLLLSY